MTHGQYDDGDGQVDDLLSLLSGACPMPDRDPGSSTPNPAAATPRAALAALREQLDEYLTHVDALESQHGQAVKVVEMCERISGSVAAVSARAMVTAYASAHQELPDGAAPGGYRRHAAREADGDCSDSWLTRRQIAAAGISAACRVSAGIAERMLDKALRLSRSMPNALARAESGDWSGYQLGAVFRSARDLSEQDLAAADERLFSKPGYARTATLTGRLRRWAHKHAAAPPEPEIDHEDGMRHRRVEFSGPDLFGMQWMSLYHSEAFIAALQHALAEYGGQVDRDDERTVDQVRADVLAAMLFGPAALAPAAAAQMGFHPVWTDPMTVTRTSMPSSTGRHRTRGKRS